MVYRCICNGFFHQIRLGSYQLALPVPGILKLCNYLQNVVAITYIFGLQLSTFLFYYKQTDDSINEIYVKDNAESRSIIVKPYNQPFMEIDMLFFKKHN